MTHTPHKLAEKFLEVISKIHHLKKTDGHFARIFDEYHDISRAIHRTETKVEPADDFYMIEIRRRRLQLKDEIYGMLVSHEPAQGDLPS